MRVDDEVGHNALCCPGHVFLGVCHADGALLPMPAGKLVPNLGHPDGPHLRKSQSHILAQIGHQGPVLFCHSLDSNLPASEDHQGPLCLK